MQNSKIRPQLSPSFLRLVAWRFMMKGTERGRFSAMTLFAWLAIGVGVAAMSLLLSVMYGFESALKDRVLKAYPHIFIKAASGNSIPNSPQWTEAIQKTPRVASVLPYLEAEMVVQSETRSLGGVVWGVPAGELARMSAQFSEGKVPSAEGAVPQAVLGSELAYRLGVTVGSHLKLFSPLSRTGPMAMLPQIETFQVAALYNSGHYDFDNGYLFLLIEDAQDVLRRSGRITGWQVWTDELEHAEGVAHQLRETLPKNLEVQSWKEFNSALFHSLKLEQFAMSVLLSFAVIIAVMNIVITLMMHVAHKRKNIGILRALGASAESISRLFRLQGLFLGGVGLMLGAVLTVLGMIYIRYFSAYQLPEIYYDRSIPIEIRPLSLILIYGLAALCILLSTLYPARKAAQMDPIAAIRE